MRDAAGLLARLDTVTDALARRLKSGVIVSCDRGSSWGIPGRRQQRLDRFWPAVSGGRHISRDTGSALRDAGFNTAELSRIELPATPAVTRELLVGALRGR
ncbi:hypothetical protein [Georgenia yuyongxinii]